MKDSTLLWTAFITGAIGVVALFLIYQGAELEESTLSQAKQMEEYDQVKVEASIRKVQERGNVTILTLQKMETIEAVAFEPLKLSEGMHIEAKGSVSEYQGRKQITLERIKIVE